MDVYKQVKRDIWACAAVFAVLKWVVFPLIVWPMTQHDAIDGPRPSGMSLHTDAETGLQYLGGQRGGLTPRLDRDGSQMRVEAVK